MIDLDQIESQFRASVKEKPVFERPTVEKVLLVTDQNSTDSAHILEQVQSFLRVLADASWTTITGDEFNSVQSLLGMCEEQRADLIITYRHLHEKEDLPYSLGTYCDMLTQVMTTPILLVPKPRHARFSEILHNTDRVMIMTDHIVGERGLVNWGLRLCEAGGRLVLTHIEDDAVYHRYIAAIGKISGLDTEYAREAIQKTLLKEANDYIDAIAEGVRTHVQTSVEIAREVRMGHAVRHFKELVEEHEVDILVFNTKDEDQMAMHGVAYSLGVELKDRPLLML